MERYKSIRSKRATEYTQVHTLNYKKDWHPTLKSANSHQKKRTPITLMEISKFNPKILQSIIKTNQVGRFSKRCINIEGNLVRKCRIPHLDKVTHRDLWIICPLLAPWKEKTYRMSLRNPLIGNLPKSFAKAVKETFAHHQWLYIYSSKIDPIYSKFFYFCNNLVMA